MTNSRGCVGSWWTFFSKDYWVPPKKGISAAISSTAVSETINTETEIRIEVINLGMAIGFAYQNVLLVEFVNNGGTWQDDLIFGTDSNEEVIYKLIMN